MALDKKNTDSPLFFKTLLGTHHLDFSIHCLSTFIKNSDIEIRLKIFDDGTLTEKDISLLEQALTGANVVTKQARELVIQEKINPFPACLAFRSSNVLGLKLFDVMLYDEDDLLFIDSDVFFLSPFSWPCFPKNEPVFMRDIMNAYSFSPLNFLKVKKKIFPNINTGLMVFPKHLYNLNLIEHLLTNVCPPKQVSKFSSGWIEQTIWAFLAGANKSIFYLNAQQFIIPATKLIVSEQVIAVHLVSNRRWMYDEIKGVDLLKPQTVKKIKLDGHAQKLGKMLFFKERLLNTLKSYKG